MLNPNVSVISVSKLNFYLKNLLDSDPVLNNILVKGEVSNLKYYPSGHIYFSLKDEEGVIKCVMFSTYADKLDVTLKDGDKIIVNGTVSIYGANGTYQLYAKYLEKDGLGNLYLEFERLKKELSNKGLFDEAHKLTIPKYPLTIGIISGKSAAGLRDVITIIKRRWPIASIYVFPCLVQGKEAPSSIISALNDADKFNLDVTILARGGGSKEDLYCFNDEALAYAIYNYKHPIISGVGHEIDFTIADFVCDLRAPTPSGAAELATPNLDEILKNLKNLKDVIINHAKRTVMEKRNLLVNYESFLTKTNYDKFINNKRMKLIERKSELKNSYLQFSLINRKEVKENRDKLQLEYNYFLKRQRSELTNEIRLLDNISPLKVLQRGYGVISSSNGVINSINKVNLDEIIKVTLSDGKLYASVTRKDDKDGK